MLFEPLLTEIQNLAVDGGWVFFALVALAFGISFSLVSLWQSMSLPDAPLIPPNEWIKLLRDRPGSEGIEKRLHKELDSCEDLPRRLQETQQRLFSIPERRFAFAFIIIGAAPLIGLLGTVSGMFTTFRGMSVASANTPIDTISQGISEALITTQTGLIIGVPAFIVCALLKSRHDSLSMSFQRLSSQLLQRTNKL
ncbi:MAG: hypothetical protein CMO47_09360 [Verrucomicrobiales bacterium]|nr:hypothetical protein [Verrucomicrobiales bacterium]|tara:strand:+ start:16008 stop:16595 length:588 start_codon:yes stop_codon:yes gene_type:complete